MRLALTLWIASASLVAPFACSSTTDLPPSAANGSPGTGAGAGGGIPSEAGPTTTDSGANGGVCNGLVANAAAYPVQQTTVSGDALPGTGGTLRNGDYILILSVQYLGPTSTATPGINTLKDYSQTIRIAGTTFESLVGSFDGDGGSASRAETYTIGTSGSVLTLSSLCPVGLAHQYQYSVTTVGNGGLTLTDTTTKEQFTYELK